MQIVSCIPPSVCRKSKATERKEKKNGPNSRYRVNAAVQLLINQTKKKLWILAEKLTAILRYALTTNLKNKTAWTSFFQERKKHQL